MQPFDRRELRLAQSLAAVLPEAAERFVGRVSGPVVELPESPEPEEHKDLQLRVLPGSLEPAGPLAVETASVQPRVELEPVEHSEKTVWEQALA